MLIQYDDFQVQDLNPLMSLLNDVVPHKIKLFLRVLLIFLVADDVLFYYGLKNQRNKMAVELNLTQLSAVNAAFAPGTGTTAKSSAIAFSTISAPGSEIQGRPASLTNATDLPSRKYVSNFSPPYSKLCS